MEFFDEIPFHENLIIYRNFPKSNYRMIRKEDGIILHLLKKDSLKE